MGRRSINTTKSGKYMNPTDQARKEARKRELKKNKKQRMLVRTAVLKGKDPHQVLADMERLDQMEFNVDAPPPLNEKVLRDKRRKLKETWDRLCRLYIKEEHEKYLELKRIEADYELKRNLLIKFYESVKSAQEVALDDIPLPSGPPEQNSGDEDDEEEFGLEPSSILKRPNAALIVTKDPPGLPPGPPPSLDEIDDGESDDEHDEHERSKKVHFGDTEKEADVNEFLKEIEDAEKTVAEGDKNVPSSPEDTQPSEFNLSEPEASVSTEESPTRSRESTVTSTNSTTTSSTSLTVSTTPSTSTLTSNIPPTISTPILTMPPTNITPAPPPIPPPVLLLRPPLMPGQMRPNMPPPNAPPRPGMGHPRPQRHNAPRGGHPQRDRNQSHKNRYEDKSKPPHSLSDKATIEAKPQLRNLSADAIRFTPLSLKIRRNEKNPKKPGKPEGQESNFSFTSNPYNEQFKQQQPTKDDAYEEFMRELKDII